MLNVACVKVGTRYGADYVNILFDMVRRNLPAKFPGRFVCFTDDATGLDPAILVKSVPQELASRGWWAKLYLFSEGAFPEGERVLYFDLDTCITGPLDVVAAYDGPFAILRDAYRSSGFQSSVMAWKAGEYSFIWNMWQARGSPSLEGGDQEWIEKLCAPMGKLFPLCIQDKFPSKFRSYKVECRTQVPRGTSVVFFHGHPRPHEVTTGWVPEVWKIGGGSGLEFVVQANSSDDTLRDNAVDALKRPHWLAMKPEHKGVALIVGGGPSLAETLFYVRGMQKNRCTVFATNNTYRYLKEQGIQPDAHVMLDARPQNIEFVPTESVPKYYASICDKSVLEAAGSDLIAWHPHQPCIHDHIKHHPSAAIEIGGGTTVGLRAIAVAYVLGYREFRLFGFDSCYRETHHAYPQSLNDGEKTVEVTVAGKRYKCAPWMVSQAEEFKELVAAMVNMGCMVTVYGEGMLQAVAEEMGKLLTEIDGLYWPISDQETRASVMHTIADVYKFVEFCPRRGVAVQAGGNVGVFPKELAKHFQKVVTFEPDAVNWECFQRNVNEPNIVGRQMALGDAPGRMSVEHNAFNPGSSYLTAGNDIEVITLDSLDLEGCDLLQLDIEGYELKALKGAETTIRKYSPVIVLEQKGLGEKYGDSDAAATEWLAARGYRKVHTLHRDVIYTRTH